MKTLITLLALMLSLSVSAQKKIGSSFGGDVGNVFVNEEYKPKKFKKILVISSVMDEKMNKKIMEAFSDLKVPMVNWIEVLPPVKEYTDDERKAIYEKNGIDGVINIKTIDTDRQTVLYATSTIMKFESEFVDLSTNTNAAKFVGQTTLGSLSTNAEKGVLQWAKLISPEIESLIAR